MRVLRTWAILTAISLAAIGAMAQSRTTSGGVFLPNQPYVLSGIWTWVGASPLVFEGATNDGVKTTLTVTDPTAARTLTLPDATDTLVGRATTDTLTNKTFTAPALTNPALVGGTYSLLRQTGTITTYTGATDAIDISLGDQFILNRAGAVDAATLADPVAADAGRIIRIYNGTTQANTITITSGIGGSGATDDVITFTNRAAASITLIAQGTKWYVVGSYLASIA